MSLRHKVLKTTLWPRSGFPDEQRVGWMAPGAVVGRDRVLGRGCGGISGHFVLAFGDI